MNFDDTKQIFHFHNSFSILSDDRSKASSKMIPPHSAIIFTNFYQFIIISKMDLLCWIKAYNNIPPYNKSLIDNIEQFKSVLKIIHTHSSFYSVGEYNNGNKVC